MRSQNKPHGEIPIRYQRPDIGVPALIAPESESDVPNAVVPEDRRPMADPVAGINGLLNVPQLAEDRYGAFRIPRIGVGLLNP
jgi:hypothetical protein